MRIIAMAGLGLLAACAPKPVDSEAVPIADVTEARPGYLTIMEAPPSPYPETVPDDPLIGQEDMFDKFARENGIPRSEAERLMNGTPEFQREVERVLPFIREREADNFVEARMIRDPSVRMEMWFKRDAAATLAKYTSNPDFLPKQGGLTQAEMRALQDVWITRSQQEPAISTISGDPFTGIVDVGVGVTEAEFRAIAERRGWTWGDNVKLSFAPARPPAFADPVLEKQVRVFAREVSNPGIRLQALFVGKIWLDEGCFKTVKHNDDGSQSEALVMFGYDTQLDRDEEGYVIVTSRYGDRYRIGEVGAWGGPNGVDETNPEVKALKAACGGGDVVNVANPESNRLFGLPYPSWVTDYAKANKLTRQQAWDRVTGCMKKRESEGTRGIDARDRCIRQFN